VERVLAALLKRYGGPPPPSTEEPAPTAGGGREVGEAPAGSAEEEGIEREAEEDAGRE
jgi:hypothetical protein